MQGGIFMLRKPVVVCLTVFSAFLAFAATSMALGGNAEPRLRSNLPAAALPKQSLSASEAVQINNVLGEASARAGITRDSYDAVRVLTTTAVGPLYLIPGTNGTCMFLDSTSVCGDPGGSSRFNALVTLDRSGETLVGGGLADSSVKHIEVIVLGHGVRTSVPVIGGIFAIELAVPDFKPGKGIKFIAH
jgi:hypothetical protein